MEQIYGRVTEKPVLPKWDVLKFGDVEQIKARKKYEADLAEWEGGKLYRVRLDWTASGNIEVLVRAKDEQEAEDIARTEVDVMGENADDIEVDVKVVGEEKEENVK